MQNNTYPAKSEGLDTLVADAVEADGVDILLNSDGDNVLQSPMTAPEQILNSDGDHLNNSTGQFVLARGYTAEPVLATGNKVTLKIRVEAAPWIPVEVVNIYRNCELVESRSIQSSKVLGKVLRFNRAIPLSGVDADSYFHVEAGIRLDAGGDPVSPGLLGTVQTIEPGVEPFGFTNAIFVDRDGDGYDAPGLP